MKLCGFIVLVLGVSLISNQSIAGGMQSEEELKPSVNGLNDVTKAVGELTPVNPPCNSIQSAADPMLISDSFVKNLNCRTLTKENVFSSLQDNAFSDDKHLLVFNWSSGVLGQCWALASAQRRIFYLTRFNVKGAGDSKQNGAVERFLKMVANDRDANVVQVEDANLNILHVPDDQKSRLATALGEVENYDVLERAIKGEQRGLFFRLSNLRLIFGSMIKDSKENSETAQKLLTMVEHGERPILIERSEATAQHAILIKDVKKIADNNYLMSYYDSNNPASNGLKLRFKDGQFYTVYDHGIELKTGIEMPKDDGMDQIREISYQYYKNLCDKTRSGS
jgi:hypothetical protein